MNASNKLIFKEGFVRTNAGSISNLSLTHVTFNKSFVTTNSGTLSNVDFDNVSIVASGEDKNTYYLIQTNSGNSGFDTLTTSSAHTLMINSNTGTLTIAKSTNYLYSIGTNSGNLSFTEVENGVITLVTNSSGGSFLNSGTDSVINVTTNSGTISGITSSQAIYVTTNSATISGITIQNASANITFEKPFVTTNSGTISGIAIGNGTKEVRISQALITTNTGIINGTVALNKVMSTGTGLLVGTSSGQLNATFNLTGCNITTTSASSNIGLIASSVSGVIGTSGDKASIDITTSSITNSGGLQIAGLAFGLISDRTSAEGYIDSLQIDGTITVNGGVSSYIGGFVGILQQDSDLEFHGSENVKMGNTSDPLNITINGASSKHIGGFIGGISGSYDGVTAASSFTTTNNRNITWNGTINLTSSDSGAGKNAYVGGLIGWATEFNYSKNYKPNMVSNGTIIINSGKFTCVGGVIGQAASGVQFGYASFTGTMKVSGMAVTLNTPTWMTTAQNMERVIGTKLSGGNLVNSNWKKADYNDRRYFGAVQTFNLSAGLIAGSGGDILTYNTNLLSGHIEGLGNIVSLSAVEMTVQFQNDSYRNNDRFFAIWMYKYKVTATDKDDSGNWYFTGSSYINGINMSTNSSVANTVVSTNSGYGYSLAANDTNDSSLASVRKSMWMGAKSYLRYQGSAQRIKLISGEGDKKWIYDTNNNILVFGGGSGGDNPNSVWGGDHSGATSILLKYSSNQFGRN